MIVRDFREPDAPVLWTLGDLPNVGATADSSVPLPLPPASSPPEAFPDLAAIGSSFDAFLVVELEGGLVGMGGLRISAPGRAEVLRVRVHPATRRRGVGRALMTALERHRDPSLDTATNQPEAVAFYLGLGYGEVDRKVFPHWTLVYYEKELG